MPFANINCAQLHYEDRGQGPALVFLHGVWESSLFFDHQLSHFAHRYRVIAPDMRGHGHSQKVHGGHTVAQYARDLRGLLAALGVSEAVLAGSSMGALVIWDYVRQFGTAGLKGTIVIDQSASDFKWDDWPLGLFDFAELCQWMARVQGDRCALLRDTLPLLFKDGPGESEARWMVDEAMRPPESIAAAILFNQTVQDYRPMLAEVAVPTLLCFGADEKCVPVAAGRHLQEHLPDARLVVFEQSGHFPFLEEPKRFNEELDRFLESVL